MGRSLRKFLGLLLLAHSQLAAAGSSANGAGPAAASAQQAAAGGLEGPLADAFLDAVERDEETQALSAELSQRYNRRDRYLLKGSRAGQAAAVEGRAPPPAAVAPG
eukprot:CAMPEP_0204570456 /NCGR_PEP_ID=MMETSP0661-20131031/38332_1 /ASSEMBLY_ACC=CAM_ASM_000606 /TAXON_ID=109239 /ORGANISM="Alexandrium margalefi, Strain AMGDE01CS-322" /LENGTH=105 /DNA_ID=CAMNT_0051578643 /DNA_START=74 /DNA_END=389 /DNA_ORIENTATION=+